MSSSSQINIPTAPTTTTHLNTLQQQKTFSKWINLHLQPTSIQISNIFEDLQDGIVLLKLLEVLCGESIKVPEIKVKMKIHKMINLECVMSFLQQRLNLDFRNFNIGAEDVASGNEKITLGLVWIIILRLQIQNVFRMDVEPSSVDSLPSASSISDPESSTLSNSLESSTLSNSLESSAFNNSFESIEPSQPSPTGKTNSLKRNNHVDAKSILLRWVAETIKPYASPPYNIRVHSFTDSVWMSGAVFGALLHQWDPELLPFFEMTVTALAPCPVNPHAKPTNLNTILRLRFIDDLLTLAETQLNIPKLLDAADFESDSLDERSLFTYLTHFYMVMKDGNLERQETQLPRSPPPPLQHQLQAQVEGDLFLQQGQNIKSLLVEKAVELASIETEVDRVTEYLVKDSDNSCTEAMGRLEELEEQLNGDLHKILSQWSDAASKMDIELPSNFDWNDLTNLLQSSASSPSSTADRTATGSLPVHFKEKLNHLHFVMQAKVEEVKHCLKEHATLQSIQKQSIALFSQLNATLASPTPATLELDEARLQNNLTPLYEDLRRLHFRNLRQQSLHTFLIAEIGPALASLRTQYFNSRQIQGDETLADSMIRHLERIRDFVVTLRKNLDSSRRTLASVPLRVRVDASNERNIKSLGYFHEHFVTVEKDLNAQLAVFNRLLRKSTLIPSSSDSATRSQELSTAFLGSKRQLVMALIQTLKEAFEEAGESVAAAMSKWHLSNHFFHIHTQLSEFSVKIDAAVKTIDHTSLQTESEASTDDVAVTVVDDSTLCAIEKDLNVFQDRIMQRDLEFDASTAAPITATSSAEYPKVGMVERAGSINYAPTSPNQLNSLGCDNGWPACDEHFSQVFSELGLAQKRLNDANVKLLHSNEQREFQASLNLFTRHLSDCLQRWTSALDTFLTDKFEKFDGDKVNAFLGEISAVLKESQRDFTRIDVQFRNLHRLQSPAPVDLRLGIARQLFSDCQSCMEQARAFKARHHEILTLRKCTQQLSQLCDTLSTATLSQSSDKQLFQSTLSTLTASFASITTLVTSMPLVCEPASSDWLLYQQQLSRWNQFRNTSSPAASKAPSSISNFISTTRSASSNAINGIFEKSVRKTSFQKNANRSPVSSNSSSNIFTPQFSSSLLPTSGSNSSFFVTADPKPFQQLNFYVPLESDALDVAVALLVNSFPCLVNVSRVDGVANEIGTRYTFDSSVEKSVLLRLRGKNVVVRVGGGWQELGSFLSARHSAFSDSRLLPAALSSTKSPPS